MGWKKVLYLIGSKIKLLLSGKGGKVTYWNAVVVDPDSTSKIQGNMQYIRMQPWPLFIFYL